MKGFTMFVLIVCVLLAEGFFIWLLLECKSLLTGFMTVCTSITVCFAIYRYSFYIAQTIVWGVRFALVFAIVAFVLGIYPKSQNSNA